jgi:hypothetical protein
MIREKILSNKIMNDFGNAGAINPAYKTSNNFAKLDT